MTPANCPICGHANEHDCYISERDETECWDCICTDKAYRWALRVLPFVGHKEGCDAYWCDFKHTDREVDVDQHCKRHITNWFAHPSHHTFEPRPCTCGLADAMGVGA